MTNHTNQIRSTMQLWRKISVLLTCILVFLTVILPRRKWSTWNWPLSSCSLFLRFRCRWGPIFVNNCWIILSAIAFMFKNRCQSAQCKSTRRSAKQHIVLLIWLNRMESVRSRTDFKSISNIKTKWIFSFPEVSPAEKSRRMTGVEELKGAAIRCVNSTIKMMAAGEGVRRRCIQTLESGLARFIH